MKHTVRVSELQQMSPEQQEEAIQRLVQAAQSQPNGEVQELDLQIRTFEEKYGLSSEDLRRELAQGKREESWEICTWLMLIDQRAWLASLECAGDHVLEAIDLLESPEQLRARFDALVEAGLEREEPAGGFSFAGERCPDCSAGWLGVAEPTSVSPHDTVGPAVAAVWMRDVRRAEAGEDVRGLYGWGMRLCPRHRIYGRQRRT